MKSTRRNFFKIAGATGAGILTAGLLSFKDRDKEIKFVSPVDGDMLSEHDGKVIDGCLLTIVKILAPRNSRIKVNGSDAKNTGEMYVTDIRLKEYRNIVEVEDVISGQRQSITVYWLKNYTNKYRLSLDDNIWFLKDITNNANKYKSIFENPYMCFLKQVYDLYGTKIHINIYYQTNGFNLSQMTAKYKSEWMENAGWLKLSFHALQNDPDKPYINAGYDEVKRDCEMVNEQIKRFAGEELMGPVTTLHWGSVTVEGCRALKDAGYKVLLGSFKIKDGQPVVSHYLDKEKIQHLSNRSIWRDNGEGIIFKGINMIINKYGLKEIVPFLNEVKKDPHKSEFLDLMIHEQYFYPSYPGYQPDFRQKVMTALKWAVDNNYNPAFLSECIFE